MLAAQMVAVHSAAMRSLRQLKSSETIMQQDSNGNLAVKLLRTYTMQMEALQRHRGNAVVVLSAEQRWQGFNRFFDTLQQTSPGWSMRGAPRCARDAAKLSPGFGPVFEGRPALGGLASSLPKMTRCMVRPQSVWTRGLRLLIGVTPLSTSIPRYSLPSRFLRA